MAIKIQKFMELEIEILVFSMLKHPTDFKGTLSVGYVMKRVLGRRMTEV